MAQRSRNARDLHVARRLRITGEEVTAATPDILWESSLGSRGPHAHEQVERAPRARQCRTSIVDPPLFPSSLLLALSPSVVRAVISAF